jgi:hypothetical protein
VIRGACLTLGIVAVAVVSSCGGGVDSNESVAGVLEHFCQYEANTGDQVQQCFEAGSEKMLHREEWGPRAQATLYALGEIKGCLSKAGNECEPATWTVDRRSSLLVERYCAYGSKSGAQEVGCIDHVRPPEVFSYAHRSYPTNAAIYAIGDSTSCGYDSGPFCE